MQAPQTKKPRRIKILPSQLRHFWIWSPDDSSIYLLLSSCCHLLSDFGLEPKLELNHWINYHNAILLKSSTKNLSLRGLCSIFCITSLKMIDTRYDYRRCSSWYQGRKLKNKYSIGWQHNHFCIHRNKWNRYTACLLKFLFAVRHWLVPW